MKFLIASLLLVTSLIVHGDAAHLKRRSVSNVSDEKCTPGSTFYEKCNKCKCSADGKSSECTDYFCVSALKMFAYENCKDATKIKRYCNTCKCSYAEWLCTNLPCDKNFYNEDGSLKDPTKEGPGFEVSKPPLKVPKFMYHPSTMYNVPIMDRADISAFRPFKGKFCDPGQTYEHRHQSHSYTCTCSEDGLNASCKIRNSPTQKGQRCEPGSILTSYQNMNNCVCTEDGLNLACTPLNRQDSTKTTTETTSVTEELATESSGLTTESAIESTTEHDKEQVCTPGKFYFDYCNFCMCSLSGRFLLCGGKICDRDFFTNDGDKKDPNQEGEFCEPNSVYKPNDCNECICNKRGTDAICTDKDDCHVPLSQLFTKA